MGANKPDFAEEVRSAWNSLRPQEPEDPLSALLPSCDLFKDFSASALCRPAATDRPVDVELRKILQPSLAGRRLYLQCVQNIEVLSWKEALDCQTQKAIKRWYNLVLLWKSELLVVKQVSSATVVEGMDILADYLRPKAPSTLNKRASSLFLLDKLLSEEGLLFPPDEQHLYDALCKLRAKGKAQSGRKGILEALNFCYFVLNIEECEELVFSRRCQGVCYVEPRARVNQASPFSLEEVLELHGIVHQASDDWDAVFAGAVLTAIYLRSRWADLQCCEDLQLDRDAVGRLCYIDLITGHHKSMQSRQHRHQFLTMTGPCVGVTSNQWVERWLCRCEAVGFKPCTGGWPVMPAPDVTGRPTVRPLSSGEMTAWIRKLLPGAAEADRKLSSHSAKCTLLSWMAKFGASQDVRACLGYHVGTSKTVFRYSRDAAASPLYELGRMLQWVRDGRFHPDNTRSGRFTSAEELEQAWWDQVRDLPPSSEGRNRDLEISLPEDMQPQADGLHSLVEGLGFDHDDPEERLSLSGGIGDSLAGLDDEEARDAANEDPDSSAEGASSSSESDGHAKSRICQLKKDGYVRHSQSDYHMRALHFLFVVSAQFLRAMALIDSEASLKQRCLPVEGDDSLFESLKANGVKTLRQLAFALGSPQTPPSDDSLKDLAAKVYKCAEGTQPTIGQIANVRMLIFEASTLVVAQLRAQATADDSDLAGRKLPHVEKQARLTSQKARLPGLLIEGELQPSYALVDACALMSESNSITWISPSRCTKRDAEVQQLGKEKTSLVQIEAGTLKVSSSSKLPDADTTTALQLLYCFQRRGLALDQCSLIGWSDHEWYVQSLMSYLHGEPVSGARPAIAQVIRADREAWTLMSREIEGPIGVKDAAGELVMAAALRRLAKDPRVVVHLVTAPQPQKVAPPPSIPTDSAAAAALAEKDTKKKKRKRLTGLVPESLKGCVTKIKAGPICWAFNLAEGCSLETKKDAHGTKCAKGYHVCAGYTMFAPDATSLATAFQTAGKEARDRLRRLPLPRVKLRVHRDSNNDDSHCNILLKLSEFQGGAVWVEGDGDIEVTDPKGRVLKGHELSWENNKITLDARNLYHATLPWTGRRLVLVGYHVRDFQRLPCDDRQRLIDIGFQCPSKPAPSPHRTLGFSSPSSGVASAATSSAATKGELIRIGLPSEPKAFVQRAVQAGHPRDGSAHVSKLVVNAIKANFSDPPAQTVTSRAAALKHWTARAKQLEQKEEELHRSLPEHLRCLLEGKRLLLWQEMHEAAGSPDDQLITHMCDGFKLSGWLSQGGLFPPKVRPPSFSVSTLSCLAKGLNQSTIAKMRVRQDEDLEKATWQETEKELQKGWIFADTKSCIELCALARRFGIRQLDKVRVIDDASICGINATVGLKYGFQMHSIDRYAAWISKALRINEGRLPACKGRVYDLKSAYKQFGIHPTDRELFRFAVNKPGEAEPMIMGANSLPFGAVGSVAAFLRISLSIWLIGVRLFSIFWTAFFDDYGVTTRDELVANTDSCICAIFDLLGVEFAREGKKAPPFSRDFKLLGVRVDLNDAPRGIVRIGNTAERREELNVFIEDILQANCLDLKTAERLRGRLVFFEGFVFGRMSNSAIRTVDRAARAGLTSKRLPEDVRKSLVVIRERLRVAEPVTIATKNHHSWLIFTDGACEGEKKLGSIGGVIVGLSGHPISFFSEQVPQDIMKILLSNSQNPIFELELLPVLVAYRLWGQWCRFSQAVFYLDNEGARHSIIAAGGGADLARVIIDGILSKETSLQIHAWYARVPTHSNIADSPSRGEYEGLLNIGCSRLRVDWDAVARQCFPLG
ncbi:dnajb6-b [Symbiodinium sp. CCMP2592]|nr:dnajb6-b [Symbiodinium sp. CCMP2592]